MDQLKIQRCSMVRMTRERSVRRPELRRGSSGRFWRLKVGLITQDQVGNLALEQFLWLLAEGPPVRRQLPG